MQDGLFLRPRKNGTATLVFSAGGKETRVVVTVSEMETPHPVSPQVRRQAEDVEMPQGVFLVPRNPKMNVTAAMMRKTMKRVFAMPAEVLASPPNPRSAAINASTRKPIAQRSMIRRPFGVSERVPGWAAAAKRKRRGWEAFPIPRLHCRINVVRP